MNVRKYKPKRDGDPISRILGHKTAQKALATKRHKKHKKEFLKWIPSLCASCAFLWLMLLWLTLENGAVRHVGETFCIGQSIERAQHLRIAVEQHACARVV